MTRTTQPTWEPGEPLYPSSPYRGHLFNFRDDPAGEACNCGDAARWPTPHVAHDLDLADRRQESLLLQIRLAEQRRQAQAVAQ